MTPAEQAEAAAQFRADGEALQHVYIEHFPGFWPVNYDPARASFVASVQLSILLVAAFVVLRVSRTTEQRGVRPHPDRAGVGSER